MLKGERGLYHLNHDQGVEWKQTNLLALSKLLQRLLPLLLLKFHVGTHPTLVGL